MPLASSLTHYFGGFASRPSFKEVRKYMSGECGHLALALSSVMPGSRLWKMGVGHFAVESADGSFWDVRGRMTREQAWEGLSGDKMEPLDRDALIAQLDTGIYGDGRYVPHREAQARRLLRQWLPPELQAPSRRRTPGMR